MNFLRLFPSIGVHSGLSIFKVNLNKKKRQMGKTSNSFNFDKVSQFWPNFIILIHCQKSLLVCIGDALFFVEHFAFLVLMPSVSFRAFSRMPLLWLLSAGGRKKYATSAAGSRPQLPKTSQEKKQRAADERKKGKMDQILQDWMWSKDLGHSVFGWGNF